jgi:quercetin dioxygenase-like cupin family protein
MSIANILETASNAGTATTAPSLAPAVVLAGSGLFVNLGDHRALGKVSAAQSGGAFLFAEMEADYRGDVPTHIHAREEETFYILEGRFEFVVDGRVSQAGVGDTVFAPRNIPRSWRCISLTGGRAIVLVTPGANFEAFAIEMSRRGIDPAAAAADPAIFEECRALCEEHGITFLPPTR